MEKDTQQPVPRVGDVFGLENHRQVTWTQAKKQIVGTRHVASKSVCKYLHSDVNLGVFADVQITQERVGESVASEVPLHDDGDAMAPGHNQLF